VNTPHRGAIAHSVCGKRVVNYTSGQGVVYGVEQYYHAPGKCSTMVLEVAARALTKHALNVHCGHDDVYGALDTGWIIVFGKDAQQAADQALILRRVTELSLTPGMNVMDGFLTSHLERTFYKHESELIRQYLGRPEDIIDCPTESQRVLFGPKRRRIPRMIDLTNPVLLGPVQNQEHYMQGVVARRNNFTEPILQFFEDAYRDFAELTGRDYGLVSQYKTDDADTVFVSLGSAAENIILERTDEPLAGDNPMGRDIRTALAKALQKEHGLPAITVEQMPRLFAGVYGLGSRDFRPEHTLGAYEFATGQRTRKDGKSAADGVSFFVVGIDHPYEVKSDETPSLLPEGSVAVRFHSVGGWGRDYHREEPWRDYWRLERPALRPGQSRR
jgi:pyruvate-ferredoxin/flavodoxin oxidoreductase